MKIKWNRKTKHSLKIAGALLLSIVGLALLPVLALPYGGLDWLAYDLTYKTTVGYPTPEPTPETVDIPCAEIPEPGDPLAALVNEQGISLSAYERELAQLLHAMETSGEDLDSEEFQALLPTYQQQILGALIDRALVQQAALEFDITVSDQEVQDEVAKVVSQGGGLESFQAWLDETGETWEEFGRDVCQGILQRKVSDHVGAGIDGTVDMVWARQIIVATEAEAIGVLSRLASGESFEEVAMEVSLDTATGEQGGDLGWFPVGYGWLPDVIEQTAFAGEPGQVQGPVQVEAGYVLLQTIERQLDYVLTPETQGALRARTFELWLAERRAESEIIVFVEFGPTPDS